MKYTAQSYTKRSKSRIQHRVKVLQQSRVKLLSSLAGIPNSNINTDRHEFQIDEVSNWHNQRSDIDTLALGNSGISATLDTSSQGRSDVSGSSSPCSPSGLSGPSGSSGTTSITGANDNNNSTEHTGRQTDCCDKLIAIEDEIDQQTRKEIAEYRLRSAAQWREYGEQSNKYFFRVIKQRTDRQTIQSLKDPNSAATLTKTEDIMREARMFYQNLYTPNDIEDGTVNKLLESIPVDVSLGSTQANLLMEDITYDAIYDILQHAPMGRSPGLDGIPFELYKYLFKSCTAFGKLLRDTLQGTFPQSCKQTRMVLLFKKGDPELLKSWRPLSLINTDAKLFTKLLANRFNKVLPSLINPYQTGFMPNRLISDNGWLS